MKRARSSRSSRFSPAEGSSSSMIVGSSANARAKPTSFCSPKGRSPTVAWRYRSSSTISMIRSPDAWQKQHLSQRVAPDTRMTRGQQIVEDAHLREELPMLKGAGEAEARDFVGCKTGDVRFAKADQAAAAIDAADAVKYAGLTGTIRADESEQFTLSDRKRHVVEDGQPTEANAQTLDGKFSHTTSASGDIV